MLSTAPRRSFSEKWPYREAMSTIVELLQPTIFAILARGIPALSIRETAVCLRSWNRQARGLTLLIEAAFAVSSHSPFRIRAARSLAASQAFLMLRMGFDGSTLYALGLNSSPPAPYRSAGNT